MRHRKSAGCTCFRPLSRRAVLSMTIITMLGVLISPAFSIYMRPDLEKIPVDKLIESLEGKLKDNGDDITLQLNLARAHAMAFTNKGQPVQVLAGKSEEGVWFGFEPTNVPFGKVVPSDDADVRKAAEAHLASAVESYEKVLKKNKDHISARLGYAWCLQQADKTDEALEQYRQVVTAAWKDEQNMQMAPLGFHSIVAEAAQYMIPLLDAEKDAAEIAELQQRAQKTSSIPRPITPIAVPLRDGLTAGDMMNRNARVRFDADGTARPNSEWTWIKPNAAWLVYDLKGDGKITSALQLFGNATFWMFWEHGYQPLALLDQDGDGELRGQELQHLALWHDANSNGVSDPGEVRPLSSYDIVALSTQTTPQEAGAENPDVAAWSAAGVTYADGHTRATYDVKLEERTTAANK